MQPLEIVLLDNATRDLRRIKHYIRKASHSEYVANNYLKRIRYHLRQLEYVAAACPIYYSSTGAMTEYRFCPIERHVAFFRIEGDRVCIDRILHSKQHFDSVIEMNRSRSSSADDDFAN